MRTRRPLLAGISYVCTLLVFLLFSFPNHCDTCAYRNITLYACSMAPGRPTAGSPCTVPPLRVVDPSSTRLFVVFDHKESRAPTA